MLLNQNITNYFKRLRSLFFFIDIYIKNISMKNLFNNISQEEKNRILEMHSGKKNVVNEQTVASNVLSGSSQKAVKQVFDSCRNIPSASTSNTNQLVDMIYKAIQGMGTDETAIMKAFSSMGTITNFCAVNDGYRKTYGNTLFSDLDGDIDQEMVWAGISRALRNLKQASVTKPTGGAPLTRQGLAGQNIAQQRPSPSPRR